MRMALSIMLVALATSADPGEPDIVDKGACPQWRQY